MIDDELFPPTFYCPRPDFDLNNEHGKKYQGHCITLIYDGVIKNGDVL